MAPIWPLPGNSPRPPRRENREPPPPPPAGPASLPPCLPACLARPRALPEPSRGDGRGSRRRGGRCPRRGLLGLVVRALGGVGARPGPAWRCGGDLGTRCLSGRLVAAGDWGLVARTAPQAASSIRGGENVESCARPRGFPLSKLPRPSWRLPGVGETVQPPVRVLGAHLMLRPKPGRHPGRTRASSQASLHGLGDQLWLLAQ